jgi:hypothetical protein
MFARVLATLPLIVGACGDNDPPGTAGGTRLALRYFTYEDGTRVVDREVFRDRARGEDCAPAEWSDGARYCTPATADVVYLDDQCSTQVARVPGDRDAHYSIQPFFAGTDALISRLHPLGAPIPSPPGVSWRFERGLCLGPIPDAEPARYFQIGAETETSDAFVRVRRSAPEGDQRLQLVRITSDDGLALPIGFHDRQLLLDCDPRASPDAATAECVPHARVTAELFADDACTMPVAAIGAITLPDAMEAMIDGCPHDFAIGERVAPDPLWAESGGLCIGGTIADDGRRTYLAGAPLALGEVTRTVTPGRRVARVALGDPARELFDSFVHDSELGVDCAPLPRGAELRCMPAAAPAAVVAARFADAACSLRRDIAYLPAAACAGTVSYAVGPDGYYRHLGGPTAGPIYELSTGDTCMESTTPPGTAPHVVGPQVPDTTFATVTLGD